MLTKEIENALGADAGDLLSRLLRDVYYAEKRGPCLASSLRPEQASTVHLAQELGLLEVRADSRLVLTAAGYELANVCKEYLNWIDLGRALPEGVDPAMLEGRRVLDVGCSYGRHIMAFSMHGAIAYGIDLQESYLRLSRVFAQRRGVTAPPLARARAEQLPFRNGEFDLVFCRVALNFFESVNDGLSELARVLKPGGCLVLTVELFGGVLRSLWASRRNARHTAWKAYGLVNTLLLQLTGRQLRIRARGRMYRVHSPTWPTEAWLRGQLADRDLVLDEDRCTGKETRVFCAIRSR